MCTGMRLHMFALLASVCLLLQLFLQMVRPSDFQKNDLRIYGSKHRRMNHLWI